MGPQIQRGKVHGTCGSAAGGNQTNDWELGEPTRQDPGMAEHEADLIRRRVAEDIMNHASRTRGTVPGHWERWAKSLLKPKVNWRQEIRNQINHAVAMVRGMSDFTFRHPSRRQAFMGNKIRLPGMYQPIPDVLFIIDTSGSMSDTYLAQCVTEVGAAIRALGNSIAFRVIAADAAAYGIQRVFKAEQIRLHGGGGTDMRVPIELAQQQKPKPDIIVVLSDGFTPWPEEKPSKHFIIILTGEKGSFPETPAYAKTIKVDTSDAKEDFKRR
jgi:predicted metal-dependent peptidase